MATEQQKKLALEIVKNSKRKKPLNKSSLLIKSGYSELSSRNNPGMIMEAEGVKSSLREMGFNTENAKQVVGEILNTGKDEHRLKAADMVFKVEGTYAPEKSVNFNVNTDATQDKKAQEVADKYEDELKKTLIQE